MSSLIPTFLSNIEYLEMNQIPKTISGRPFRRLNYRGEKYEKLSDSDVKNLCNALMKNTCFCGSIILSKNNLTDLSGLYIAEAMNTFSGLQKLDLSNNNLCSRAGEYIGDVLIENPNYSLKELSFKGNKLEENGTRRIIVAATINTNLKVLNIGVISDFGLDLISQELMNMKLIKFGFQEDKSKPFSDKSKDKFTEAFQNGIDNSEDFTIQKIKANLIEKDERIEYYCKERKEQIKEFKEFKKRNKSLALKQMASKVMKCIEGK